MRETRPLLVAFLASMLAAGAAHGREAGSEAAFSPEVYFAGRTRSQGVLKDAFGEPSSRFTGATRGRRGADGATTFAQTIAFDDGTRRDRTWRIVRTGPNRVEATATDIVGVAQGEIEGRTLHLAYTVRLTPDDPSSEVDFDQTLTLQQDGRTLLNHADIGKFGLTVRKTDEVFVREGTGRSRRAVR